MIWRVMGVWPQEGDDDSLFDNPEQEGQHWLGHWES